MGRKGFLLVAAALAAWMAFAPSAMAYGVFEPYEPYPTGGAVYGADGGDFNGDHIVDLVVGNDNPSHITLIKGRKNGVFIEKHMQTITDPREPEGIVVGKFNSDRRSDFAAADYNGGSSSTVSIFLGRKTGKPKLHGTPLAAGDGAWEIATADLNGDHKTDLVTGNYSGDTTAVSVLLGQGKAKFADHVDYAGSPGAVIGLALGDMNSDTFPDIVTLDDAGNVAVFLNNGDGTFAAPITTAVMGSDTPGYGLVLGNFDSGTTLDAVVGDYTAGKVVFLPGTDDGHFGTATLSTSSGTNGIATADFDLDGDLDLAVGVYDSLYGVRFLNGNGDGTFSFNEFLQGDQALGATEFVLAKKMSKDAAPDVMTGNDGGVNVFINCKNNANC